MQIHTFLMRITSVRGLPEKDILAMIDLIFFAKIS